MFEEVLALLRREGFEDCADPVPKGGNRPLSGFLSHDLSFENASFIGLRSGEYGGVDEFSSRHFNRFADVGPFSCLWRDFEQRSGGTETEEK